MTLRRTRSSSVSVIASLTQATQSAGQGTGSGQVSALPHFSRLDRSDTIRRARSGSPGADGLPKASGESSRQKAFPARRMVEAAGVEPASENRPIKASTCLACVFCLASKRPHRKGHLPASPLSLALLPRAGEEKPAHLYDAFPSPVSEERWAWLLVRQPVPAVGWQLCVSHLFYEEDGTSACRLY